jgi:cytochrome b
VRVAHWGVALAVVADLVNEAGANPWHRWIGYTALGLVAMRLTWGFVGPRHARIEAMLRSAASIRSYLKARGASAYEGHNPLGALMAFTLWGLVIACGVTGWMLQLDRFWGDETLQALHEICAYTLAAFVPIHVTGAVVTSVRQRTNLVKAMFTGVKRIPSGRFR